MKRPKNLEDLFKHRADNAVEALVTLNLFIVGLISEVAPNEVTAKLGGPIIAKCLQTLHNICEVHDIDADQCFKEFQEKEETYDDEELEEFRERLFQGEPIIPYNPGEENRRSIEDIIAERLKDKMGDN